MKILTIVCGLGKGGTERTAQNFAIGFKQIGHDSKLLAVNNGGLREQILQAKSIDYWVGWKENIASITEWNPDLVYIHSHLIDTEFDIEYFFRGALFVEQNVFSKPSLFTKFCTFSFQLSTWAACKFSESDKSHKYRIEVLPNAVDCTAFKRATNESILEYRKKYNIPKTAFVLGRVGQAYEGKWSTHLIDMFNKFCENKEDAYLILVCPSPSIIKSVNSSSYRRNIKIIDQINTDFELSLFYSSLNTYAHIAEQGESFGLSIAESLLCGTPVVTLSTPWDDNTQQEIVINGYNGFVALNMEQFYSSIDLLYNDKAILSNFFNNCRESIVEKFDYIKICKQFISIISHREEHIRKEYHFSYDGLKIYKNSFKKPSLLNLALLKINIPRKVLMVTSGYISFRKSLFIILKRIW